jgi:hypothetical protein
MFMNATAKESRRKIRNRRLVFEGGRVWEVVLARDWADDGAEMDAMVVVVVCCCFGCCCVAHCIGWREKMT